MAAGGFQAIQHRQLIAHAHQQDLNIRTLRFDPPGQAAATALNAAFGRLADDLHILQQQADGAVLFGTLINHRLVEQQLQLEALRIMLRQNFQQLRTLRHHRRRLRRESRSRCQRRLIRFGVQDHATDHHAHQQTDQAQRGKPDHIAPQSLAAITPERCGFINRIQPIQLRPLTGACTPGLQVAQHVIDQTHDQTSANQGQPSTPAVSRTSTSKPTRHCQPAMPGAFDPSVSSSARAT